MICTTIPAPQYFIFSENTPSLLYYSHLSSFIVALSVGFFVFYKGKKELPNRILFYISLCFSAWIFINLITWTNNVVETVFSVWLWFGLLYALISLLSIYFIYTFIDKKDISFRKKVFFALLLLPVIILSPTKFNLSGFNYELCGSSGFEGNPFLIYYTLLGILAMVWVLVILIKRYLKAEKVLRKEIILIGLGVEAFLFTFFFAGFLASYLNDLGILSDYTLEFYGLFGMTFFMAMLAYIVVRFKAFDVKAFGAQVLIFALIILIGSQFFYANNTASIILTAITLVVTGIIGINLMRSVKREIEQREKIEKVEKDLELANIHLKELDIQKTEFISFATHQLRGPLTAVKGYASLLIEGDYGEMSAQVKDAVKVIYESTQSLLLIVGDYLNVSRMEQGRMKYDLAEFDLKTLVEDTVKELSPNVSYAGLSLNFEETKDSCVINADRGKIKEVISNMIDNATKYTKSGGINIKLVKVDQDKCRILIKDTGIGIPADVMPQLFEKFSRAPDASKTNIMGTGLGLYVAKKIIEQHKGRIWAESEGKGLGSTFIIELKLVSADAHIPEAVKKFAEGL